MADLSNRLKADLSNRLKGMGTTEQIKNTVDRINENTNWTDYMRNHPFNGTLINPYSIKDIVEDYYNNKIVPIEKRLPSESLRVPSAPENDYEFIKKEKKEGPYCHYHEGCALETWYIYKDKKTGEEIKSKTQLHGGKRKSSRNQKNKKSSKKSSKKYSKKSSKKYSKKSSKKYSKKSSKKFSKSNRRR